MYCVGLMTGTSVDGIDVALCDVNGFYEDVTYELIDFETYPIDEDIRERIFLAMDPKTVTLPLISGLNSELAQMYAFAVENLVGRNFMGPDDISFIASHGQTVFHDPHAKLGMACSTLQLGDGNMLAEYAGIPVVWNFRTSDIAAGGEGAPLVPFVDKMLFGDTDQTRAFVNIGGISNITLIPGNLEDDKTVVAFDMGPGNMMIDAACRRFFNCEYDDNGEIARSGKVNKDLLDELMGMDYFKVAPPKSTGRELFGEQFTNRVIDEHSDIAPEDFVATFTEFTAASIADAIERFFPEIIIDNLILSGGGALNEYLIERIESYNVAILVDTIEDHGYESDAKEAIAFCILGYHTYHRKPCNLPEATGATHPVILGSIAYC